MKTLLIRCLLLADPPIPADDMKRIGDLIRIYIGKPGPDDFNDHVNSTKIYTVAEDILKEKSQDSEMADHDETKRYGIWEESPGKEI